MVSEVSLRAVDELSPVLQRLSAELAQAGLEFRKIAVDLLKDPTQLCAFDRRAAAGAGVALLLKPTELLFDFVAAVRARNLNDFLIKYPHLRGL